MKNEYFDSEEFKELLSQYEKSLDQGSSIYLDSEDFCDIADYYIMLAEADKAFECVERGLKVHADDEILLSAKASTYIFQHKYEEARSILNRCNTDMDEVQYQKAQLVYALDHDVEKAEEMMLDWIEAQKKELQYETDEKRKGECLRDCYIHAICTFIELTEDKQYDLELVSRWIEDYVATFTPLGDYDCDLILADTVREEGLMEMLVRVYSDILENHPYINYGWTVLSNAQFLLGQYEEAIESTDFALAINPDDMDALLVKAHCLYSTSRRVEAIPLFERYIENTSDNSQFLAYAICLIVDGKYEQAYENILLAEPYYESLKSDKLFYAQSSYELADAYLACEKLDDSERCIRRSLEISPEEPVYVLLLATIQLMRGKVEEATDNFVFYLNNTDNLIFSSVDILIRLVSFGYDGLALDLISALENNEEITAEDIIPVLPYKAMAYAQLEKMAEFAEVLKQCCELCPERLQHVFGHLFPQTVLPSDYYTYYMSCKVKPF